jgi:alkylated DNA repair dioxygenase AlkB
MWNEIVTQSNPVPHSAAVNNASSHVDEWPLPSISTKKAAAVSAARQGFVATLTPSPDHPTTAVAAAAAAPSAPSVASFWAGGRCGEVTVLESGLVLIKGAVSPEEQVKMAAAAMSRGDLPDPQGFRNATGQLNSTKTRGRIYDAVTTFDGRFRELCQQVVHAARSADVSMPAMDPTHLLMLFYTSARGMGYHRDEGENDGQGDEPVVSVSLGNSSEFAVKHTRDEPPRTVLLESGDAILFGGACRKILHSVTQVHPQTSPPWLNGIVRDARLNFTFRCAPEAIGRESTDFQYYIPGRATKGAAAAGGYR